jgi:hypothetical protein
MGGSSSAGQTAPCSVNVHLLCVLVDLGVGVFGFDGLLHTLPSQHDANVIDGLFCHQDAVQALIQRHDALRHINQSLDFIPQLHSPRVSTIRD